MAWDGHWAHTRDWQAYHDYHGRHPGDNIPFPTPFHGSAKRKCGFFPQHHGSRVNCGCIKIIIIKRHHRKAWIPRIETLSHGRDQRKPSFRYITAARSVKMSIGVTSAEQSTARLARVALSLLSTPIIVSVTRSVDAVCTVFLLHCILAS